MVMPIAAPGLTDREAQIRKNHIGSSESAAILGVSPWATAADIYYHKVADIEVPDNMNMRLGRLYEPLILEFASQALQMELTRVNRLRVHPAGVMQSTVDAFVVGQNAIVEAKKVRYQTYLKDKNQWGEEWTDQIPKSYIIQAQHQLHVLSAATGEDWGTCHVAVCIGDDDFRMYVVKRNPQLGAAIEQRISEFWNHHVVPRIPPPDVSPGLSTMTLLPRAYKAVFRDLDPRWIGLYQQGKALVKQGEDLVDQAKVGALLQMGTGYDEARTPAGDKVTFRETTQQRFDTDRLKSEHPQLAAQFRKDITFRAFRVYPAKKDE